RSAIGGFVPNWRGGRGPRGSRGPRGGWGGRPVGAGAGGGAVAGASPVDEDQAWLGGAAGTAGAVGGACSGVAGGGGGGGVFSGSLIGFSIRPPNGRRRVGRALRTSHPTP